MKSFTHIVKDPVGIHAGPAGRITRKAKEYADTTITIEKGEKSVVATKLMMLMGMGVKGGDTVTVTVSGADEERVAAELQAFLAENL